MAYTNLGLQQVQSVGIASVTRYLSQHLSNGTELSGHGYARTPIAPSEMSVAADGTVTVTTPLDTWTANDGSAQDPDMIALYRTATGADQLMEPEDLTTDVGAPTDGQTVQMTTLTLNP